MCVYKTISRSQKVDADSPCVRTHTNSLTHTLERESDPNPPFPPPLPFFPAGKLKKMARQMGSNSSSPKGGGASLGSATKKRLTPGGSRRPTSRTSRPLSANGRSPLLLYCVCVCVCV